MACIRKRFKQPAQERLFEKGRQIFSEQTDIVTFLKTIMKLEKIVEHKNRMTMSEKSFFDAKSFAKIEESNDNDDHTDDEHLATKL